MTHARSTPVASTPFGSRRVRPGGRAAAPSSFALEAVETRTLLSAPAHAPAAAKHAPDPSPAVYAPHSKVHGQTIGEWSADWWQWAVSSSMPNDPFTDATGANANLGQHGSVFFLAGNTGGSTERTFTVPGNKAILVPLLVGEYSQAELGFDKTPAQIRAAADAQADLIDELHLSVDGVALANPFAFREASPDFHFVAPAGNAIGLPAGDSGVAVADGYFVMLKPLGPGEHVIEFGGGITAFEYSVDVTDHVAVNRATPPGQGGGQGHGNACGNNDRRGNGRGVWDQD